MRRWKLGALMMTLCLLLSGCGKGGDDLETQAAQAQAVYQAMTGCTAQAEITADYGERVYSYTVQLQGTAEAGSLTVTAPELLAGAGTAWEAGKRSLQYEDLTLDTGDLSPDGLSPADAVPLVLRAAAEGDIAELAQETLDDTPCLRLDCADPAADGEKSEVCLWLAQDGFSLVRAEVRWAGRTVVTLEFTDVQLT